MALMALMISLSAAFTYLHQRKPVTLVYGPDGPRYMHICTAAMRHMQIDTTLIFSGTKRFLDES